MILGWLCYALGRFLIGAWVGRREWIARAADFLPGWRTMLRWALPAGLILEGLATLLAESPLLEDFEHREYFADVLHLLAVPVLAAGYVAAIVVAFLGARGRTMLAPFAAVGRMALTNYLTQSLVYGFVLFGVGPGLALAGKIGTTAILADRDRFFRDAGRVQPLVVRAPCPRPRGMGMAKTDIWSDNVKKHYSVLLLAIAAAMLSPAAWADLYTASAAAAKARLSARVRAVPGARRAWARRGPGEPRRHVRQRRGRQTRQRARLCVGGHRKRKRSG